MSYEGHRSGEGAGGYRSESGRRSPGRRRGQDWDRDPDQYRFEDDSHHHNHHEPSSSSSHPHHHNHNHERLHHRPLGGADFSADYYDDDLGSGDRHQSADAGGLLHAGVPGRFRGGLDRRRAGGSRSPSPGELAPGDEGAVVDPGRRHHRHGDDSVPHPGRHRASPCLILGGFPDCAVEQDVLMGLDYATEDPRFSAEKIQAVRVRNSKRGARIAFIDFHKLSDAERFYDDFPSITFPLQHSRGVDSEPVTVTVDFSKKPREEPDGWTCVACGINNYPQREVCFKCKAERPDIMPGFSHHGYGSSHGPILTGETDEDLQQMPSQFIVIRDLEPSVTEEVLAKGVMKLFREDAPQAAQDTTKPKNKLKSTAPSATNITLGATPGSLRRVFLIRDRGTNESWRYGFAEFATIEDARLAVAKYHALPKFTISSKLVIVAFIHTGVFVPATEPTTEEEARFSFAPVYNPSVRVKYWDDRAYPSILVVNAPDPVVADEVAEKPRTDAFAQDASSKKSRKDREALAAKIASKMAGVAMAPQMQMWAQKSAEIHGASKKSARQVTGDNEIRTEDAGATVAQVEESTDPVAPSWRDQYVSYADWDTIECLLCGKFTQEEWLIYHETHVHDHFKDEDTKAKAAALLSARGKLPKTVVRRIPRRKCDAPQPYTSYADQEKLVCYICMRKLPDIKTLRRHEQESELHNKNLSNPSTIETATARLSEAGWKPTRMLPLGYDGPLKLSDMKRGYRDRARERRQVYNQSNRPKMIAQLSSEPSGGAAGKRKTATTEKEEEPPAKKSKGAGLLAKMGWSAGEGLGASGDGRKEAVAADVYLPGVGLGAEGGKLGDAAEEAARKTRGDQGGFVEKTREKARERFVRLG